MRVYRVGLVQFMILRRFLEVIESARADIATGKRTENDTPAPLDGWHSGDQEIGATGEWTDVAFTAYLTKGAPALAFRWTGGASSDRLDVMYVTVQEQRAEGP